MSKLSQLRYQSSKLSQALMSEKNQSRAGYRYTPQERILTEVFLQQQRRKEILHNLFSTPRIIKSNYSADLKCKEFLFKSLKPSECETTNQTL